MSGQVVEDPVRRQRYRFRLLEHDVLEIELWIDPGGEVPPHLHPRQTERFEVLSGEVTFRLGRRTTVAGPGKVLEVPPGTRHRFLNKGSETAHARVEVTPPLELRRSLEEAAALARAGRMTRFNLPTSPAALVELAAFARRYRDTTVVLSPPPLVQRVFGDPLARLANRG